MILVALTAGLYSNVIKALHPSQKYAAVQGGAVAVNPEAKKIKYFCHAGPAEEGCDPVPRERVFLHPSSVNFRERSFPMQYIIYHQKVGAPVCGVGHSSQLC